MNLPRWLTPWRKALTDQNAVTPISAVYTLASKFGTILESFGGAWQSNMRLDTKSVLSFSAVYACLSLISSDISKLRPTLLRRQSSGIWRPEDVSAYTPVLRKPNHYQTRIQFIEYWVLSKLIYGNTLILKERDASNKVRKLHILDWGRVTPLVAPDGEVYYRLNADALPGLDGETPTVPTSEVIHDRGKCLFHPLIGVAPLFACAASVGQGTRIQTNSDRFFANMSRPSGHLTAPGKINDETAERLKREFEKGFGGENVGRLFVSGSDLKFEPFTIPAEQAQLIEQLKFTVEDVARAFNMPLYKVQAGQAPTFNNVGALNLEYYQQVLQPYIESIELLLDEGLGLPSDLSVEFDLDGLFRMDPLSRAEIADKRIKAGTLKPNEARAADNLPPVEGGDACYLQQQNYSLSALAKRDASDDPFGTAKPAPLPPAKPDIEADAAKQVADLMKQIVGGFACKT